MRDRAREAFRLTSDMLGDLLTGTQIYVTLQLPIFAALREHEGPRIGINRFCLFQLFITLSKWTEFYDKYRTILPADVKADCLRLKREIEERGIREFRNKVAGHIWDKEARRPLTNAEVERRIDIILGGNIPKFLRWINDPTKNAFPSTVLSIIEHTRDRIREVHNFTDADLASDAPAA